MAGRPRGRLRGRGRRRRVLPGRRGSRGGADRERDAAEARPGQVRARAGGGRGHRARPGVEPVPEVPRHLGRVARRAGRHGRLPRGRRPRGARAAPAGERGPRPEGGHGPGRSPARQLGPRLPGPVRQPAGRGGRARGLRGAARQPPGEPRHQARERGPVAPRCPVRRQQARGRLHARHGSSLRLDGREAAPAGGGDAARRAHQEAHRALGPPRRRAGERPAAPPGRDPSPRRADGRGRRRRRPQAPSQAPQGRPPDGARRQRRRHGEAEAEAQAHGRGDGRPAPRALRGGGGENERDPRRPLHGARRGRRRPRSRPVPQIGARGLWHREGWRDGRVEGRHRLPGGGAGSGRRRHGRSRRVPGFPRRRARGPRRRRVVGEQRRYGSCGSHARYRRPSQRAGARGAQSVLAGVQGGHDAAAPLPHVSIRQGRARDRGRARDELEPRGLCDAWRRAPAARPAALRAGRGHGGGDGGRRPAARAQAAPDRRRHGQALGAAAAHDARRRDGHDDPRAGLGHAQRFWVISRGATHRDVPARRPDGSITHRAGRHGDELRPGPRTHRPDQLELEAVDERRNGGRRRGPSGAGGRFRGGAGADR